MSILKELKDKLIELEHEMKHIERTAVVKEVQL